MNKVVDDKFRAVIDEREAAKYIGVCYGWIGTLRRLGTGPVYIKLGERRVGYRIADLDAWLEGNASNNQPK